MAQTTFSVATLNVDGLPNIKILGIPINADGPGESGTMLASKFLAEHNYDIIGVQEDFNFNDALMSSLVGYEHSTHRGGISSDDLSAILWNNGRIDTDGLMLLWKQKHSVTNERIFAWTDYNGRLTAACDGLIMKGYREYLVTLDDGFQIDVFVLHMDAGSAEGDKEARRSQLIQLRNALLAEKRERPAIIMGDTNCYYSRDNVISLLFNPINESGKMTIEDAWRIKGQNQEETLDKVFYINPTEGPHILPQTFTLCTDYVREDGVTPIGDHYPIAVVFKTSNSQDAMVEDVDADINNGIQYIYSYDGRRLQNIRRGINIIVGKDGIVRKIIKK